MNASLIWNSLLESFRLNGQIFAVTLALGLPLGLLISFGTMSRFAPLRAILKVFVWIMRGTPLMLQIIIVFYGPGLILGIRGLPVSWRMNAVLLAFALNYACYFSEIFRGGIQSVPGGQREAGEVLGMTKTQIFCKVTLLQMVKRILPPMGNELITLVKDTSLARVVMVKEIIAMAQDFASSKGLIWPLFSTGIFFLAASGILTLLLSWSEKKLGYFR